MQVKKKEKKKEDWRKMKEKKRKKKKKRQQQKKDSVSFFFYLSCMTATVGLSSNCMQTTSDAVQANPQDYGPLSL